MQRPAIAATLRLETDACRGTCYASRMRDLMRAGASAVAVVVLMLGGSLGLWIGVPVATLYLGSRVQTWTDSLGGAIFAMFAFAILAAIGITTALVALNRKHVELREARGLESYGSTVLEMVMVASAAIAVVGFVFWFLILQGPSPSIAPSN